MVGYDFGFPRYCDISSEALGKAAIHLGPYKPIPSKPSTHPQGI